MEHSKGSIVWLIMLLFLVAVMGFNMVNLISTSKTDAVSEVPYLTVKYTDEIPKISVSELVNRILENPYNAKSVFDAQTKVVGKVVGVSVDGDTIYFEKGDTQICMNVKDLIYSYEKVKLDWSGKTVELSVRELFGQYLRRVKIGDEVTLICDGLEQGVYSEYILQVSSFDIADIMQYMGVESETDLIELFGIVVDEQAVSKE